MKNKIINKMKEYYDIKRENVKIKRLKRYNNQTHCPDWMDPS